MNRAERVVRRVELGDVHLHPAVFRETVDNVARLLHFSEEAVHRAHCMVEIAPAVFRRFAHVGVARHEIQRQLIFLAESQEIAHPVLRRRAAADRRAADAHVRQHFLNCLRRHRIQVMILLFIRIFPETRQVRLVPHLARPSGHFVFPVALRQMCKRRLNHRRPLCVVLRRRNVALPIEDGLRAARHLFRHESQFKERLQTLRAVIIHHAIKVGEIVALAPISFRILIRLVNRHIVAEQPVTADVRERAFRLCHRQLLLILLLERQPHASRADAERGVVVELRLTIRRYADGILLHGVFSPYSPDFAQSNTST